MNVVFKSDNLDFVNVSIDLIDDYLIMINDPMIQECISTKKGIYTYENEVNWVNKKLEEKSLVFSIIERASGEFVGNIELMNVHDGCAEMGICLTPKFINRHYGTEAIKRILEYAFNELKLNVVELIVFSNNLRAIHCYKKIGFVEYDIRKNVKEVDDESVDNIYMRLMR